MLHLINSLLIGSSFLLTLMVFLNPLKVNKKGNVWFGFFILSLFAILLINFLLNSNLVSSDSKSLEWLELSNFIIAPLFFFSISYLVEPIRRWKWIDLSHFALGIFLLLLVVINQFLPEFEPNEQELNNEFVRSFMIVFSLIFGLQVLLYTLFSYIKIVKHQKRILEFSADIYKKDLQEIKNICVGIIIMAFLWIADIFFNLSENYVWFDFVSSLIDLIIVVYIAINWLQQKEIFPFNEDEKTELDQLINSNEIFTEPKKKLLDEAKLKAIKNDLFTLMSTQKPYLDPELSLIKLADNLKVTPHILSYVINEGLGDNFYTFVNKYRIEEAKLFIADPKMNYLNILGIAYEAGFNSKTTFNTTFKKITGITPSEYKKSLK